MPLVATFSAALDLLYTQQHEFLRQFQPEIFHIHIRLLIHLSLYNHHCFSPLLSFSFMLSAKAYHCIASTTHTPESYQITNTNTPIPIHQYQYTNTNTPIPIHQYTNTPIPIHQ